MVTQFPTVNKVLLTARTFVSVSMMKRFVILETLRGAETIFVFHEVKIDVTLGGGNYSSLKSIIFSSSSPTLFFLLFTSLLPPFSQYQKMGGTWEVLGRNVFVLPSLLLCFPIDTKAKFYRRQSEVLSKTYRRWGEEGAEKEQRGSRGRIWLQSYKIPKSHFHLFGR